MPRKTQKRQYKGGDAASYAAAVYGDANNQHAASGSNVIASNPVKCGQNGGKKQQSKQGGNVLSDIAVPAVLLTANQLYKKRTLSKRSNSSRRYRGKTRRAFYKRR